MYKIEITLKNTSFVVKLIDYRLIKAVNFVLGKLSTYTFIYNHKLRKKIKILNMVFASKFPDEHTYIFNINILKDFILVLKMYGVVADDIKIYYETEYTIKKIKNKFNTEYKLKDYQVEYDKFVCKDDSVFKLVDLRMGYGKTVIAMHSVIKINNRVMILVLPKYIEKWKGDIKNLSTATGKDIYIMGKGGDSIRKATMMAENNDFNYDFIICSIRTISNYIKEYEKSINNDEIFTYDVLPQDLLKILGVGTVLNDEAHQEFYSVFKSVLYLNPKKMIGLSATLDSNDRHIREIYDIMYPPETKLSNVVKYVPYIDVYAVKYFINGTKRIQYKRTQGYNHIMFEQSVMRNTVLLREYLNMIMEYVKEGYTDRREKGDKCLIFASTVDMCTLLVNYIKKINPQLDIRRYVEDDPYENIIESDMCISTVLSAGVAIDIPNLITIIQTISIGSLQANKQALGRLRNIPNKHMRYYYIYSGSIDKQVTLHNTRYNILKDLAKTYKFITHRRTLKGF